ncbi:hypothetical protein PV327_009056 [Microctonus hyperodae]|uniref:Nucleoside diphosphate kinase-like domain-containing protein n=1 Tax=Microctonus hyperodae TaxID=165561 RepID=A0AA39FTP0_MICHY|nr:hypothetical protein PV327_009056 [Microctonus hyperodae]
MCDCPEIKSFANKSDMKIIGKNTITINDSCSKNQSSIRDFTDENFTVKSLINWTPLGKKCPIHLVADRNFYIPEESISELSLDYSSGESSETYQSVIKHDVACGSDGDEGEFQDNEHNDNDNDVINEDIDSFISENKCRVEPKNIEHISEIPNENKSDIEYTLAIIYPDIFKYQMFLEQIIIDEGFEICRKQILQMTPEQASEFFIEKYGELQFPRLIAYMSSSPIVVFVIAKYQAINDWLQLIGPEEITKAKLYYPDCIRAKYGNDEQFENAVHGSGSYAAARREIRFFFPDFILEPILTGDKVEQYLWNTINHVLQKGIKLCCKIKPEDPLLWLADWLLKNNPNKPQSNE